MFGKKPKIVLQLRNTSFHIERGCMYKKVLFGFVFVWGSLFAQYGSEIGFNANPRGPGGPIGVGAALGDPLGLTGKYYLNNTMAIQIAAGLGYSREEGFQINGDYVWHPHVIGATDDFVLSWYLGAGMGVLIGEEPNLNARFPLGVQGALSHFNLDAFIQVDPGFAVVKDQGFTYDVVTGIRFYFQ